MFQILQTNFVARTPPPFPIVWAPKLISLYQPPAIIDPFLSFHQTTLTQIVRCQKDDHQENTNVFLEGVRSPPTHHPLFVCKTIYPLERMLLYNKNHTCEDTRATRQL